MPEQMPALIFDLDGTLTDSKPGIVGCLQHVVDARQLGDRGPLGRFVGPPVEEWVKELLPEGTNEDRLALARDYRACYDREGWKNNSVHPGVREMLRQLHGLGFPMFVCTSKHEHFAIRIVEHFELTPFFGAVYGDRLDLASHRKEDLLGSLMREHSLTKDGTWMIGDRIFDIRAAQANQIKCLAAGWGYGPPEECAQADAVAATPAEVAGLVTPAGLKDLD
jgi:phosphoglycolate phosphatase